MRGPESQEARQGAGGPGHEGGGPNNRAPNEAPAPKKSPTMTRFSAHEKELMKSGNRTAYVALPKNVKTRRATKNDVPMPGRFPIVVRWWFLCLEIKPTEILLSSL